MEDQEKFILVGAFISPIFYECASPDFDGQNVFFIPLEHYSNQSNAPAPDNGYVYVVVGFPESQLFMDGHQDKIYLINDENGINEFGPAAYFVEEGLYEKVVRGLRNIPSPVINLDID